jgi:hypothetical protein
MVSPNPALPVQIGGVDGVGGHGHVAAAGCCADAVCGAAATSMAPTTIVVAQVEVDKNLTALSRVR